MHVVAANAPRRPPSPLRLQRRTPSPKSSLKATHHILQTSNWPPTILMVTIMASHRLLDQSDAVTHTPFNMIIVDFILNSWPLNPGSTCLVFFTFPLKCATFYLLYTQFFTVSVLIVNWSAVWWHMIGSFVYAAHGVSLSEGPLMAVVDLSTWQGTWQWLQKKRNGSF